MADQPDEVRNIFDARSTRERSERAQELSRRAFDGMRQTRRRQEIARKFLMGDLSANLPKAVREAFARVGPSDRDLLEYHAPQAMRRPLEMVSELAAKVPQAKRHPVSRARESGNVSTRIERISQGVMGTLYPYRQSCDPLLLDSEAATTVVPNIAHWAAPNDQYEYLTAEQWGQLPEELRDLWDWRPNESGGRYRRYARQYRRDREGRPEWADEYQDQGDGAPMFREDTEASANAVQQAIEDRVRSRIPLEINLWLPSQMAPINPRMEGDTWRVDGLAVVQEFSGTDLYRRGYRWYKDGPGLLPADSMGAHNAVTLHSVYLSDGDGRPYLIYCVSEGANIFRTERQGDNGEYAEVIDLYEAAGFDFLPVVWRPGLHVMHANADEMIIPWLTPEITPGLMRDRLVAMNDFHVQQTACGGWFYTPTAEARDAMAGASLPQRVEIKQMAVTMVPGPVTPAVHPGAGPGLAVQKAILDQDLMAADASNADSANSGIERALITRDKGRGMSMVWDAIDGLFADTATNANRALACLARHRGEPITLNILTEMPGEGASAKKSTVTIDPDMFGGDYRMVAWRAEEWGSNPTKQAMLMDAQKNKQASWTEMRESVGDPDPMGTLAQIFVEDLVMNTPEGKQMVLDEEAKRNGDLREMERARLRAEQLMNEQNIPTGMAAGVGNGAGLQSETPGAPVPGVTLDVATGNPAAAQLGAVQGAPLSATSGIAAAGGDVSGLDFGAGV